MQPAALADRAARLGVELTASQCELLERYVQLLKKWNTRFNLISRRDVARIWPRHILDSLSVLPLVREIETRYQGPVQAFDVGSGAGLPGVPLAIGGTDVQWLLLDRNARKVRFLELVAAELALPNVAAQRLDLGREDLVLAEKAHLIVSRAVDNPTGLVHIAGPLLREDGVMVLLSGTAAARAVTDPSPPPDPGSGFRIEAVQEYLIPGLDRTHEVTIIRHAATNP